MKKYLLYSLLFISCAFAQESRLLRFPAVSANAVVFSYAGDLYTVPLSGGVARRLTSDAGYEMFPRFSPDGKTIAFTGQYDGNTEVYIMPAEGGTPFRASYTATLRRDEVSDRMGPNNIVMCWSNDTTVIFRSRWREFNDFKGQLYSVSKNGGLAQQLPLPRGGFASFSPDGKKMAYNRVFREFRTWKRYRGGQADEVWVYDFTTKKTEKITDNPAQDIIPMWMGNTIYFLSDRDGKLNLFSYNTETKESKQLTSFKEYDCKFPSAGAGYVVYENGGYIYLYNAATGENKKLSITINEDFASGRDELIDVSKSIASFEIAPDGKRALLSSRGDIFTVPEKNGPTRNLTRTPGVHDRNPKWSPDGKNIAWISDATGEDEIFMTAQDGTGQPVQITSGSKNYKYELYWSPDSKKIMWSDREQNLWFVDVASKKVSKVDYSPVWEIGNYVWSPDSKFIAYVKQDKESSVSCVYLYSLETGNVNAVTDVWFSSDNPVFSRDGKYLYFSSNRNFSPQYSWTEWNHAYRDMTKLYALALASGTKSPFAPKSDEVSITDDGDKKDSDKKDSKKEDKGSKDGKKDELSVSVDFNAIDSRIIEIPIPAGNYWNLQAGEGKLYYMRNSGEDPQPSLYVFDFDKAKETEVAEAGGYELSANGKKMIVAARGSNYIIDAPSGKADLSSPLSLGELKVKLDKHAEWKQIFDESWRQMRDFFFTPTMHGVDWAAMKKRYEVLLLYVNHRADLTYIIGEMISELNVGHAYVGGGDLPKVEKIDLGLLGADFERDKKTGFYKISRILPGKNWEKKYRSPLTDLGVNVKEGEFIVAVNNKSTALMNNIYESLVNTAGKQVLLTVNDKPSFEGSRTVTVIPSDDEQEVMYINWIEKNIEKVNKATDGKVGYIHIPDMGPAGLNQFVKYYYPQLKKEGLIIDVRGNGGGNVSPMIIERLRREPAMINITRNTLPTPNPDGMFLGPKVALLDEFSASDGDIFSYRFKHYKLGKTIGKRSWGGVVGIRGTLPFLDGGVLNRPEFSRYDLEGKQWIMEGHGVDPDIVVDNDPALEFEGTDQQLNKAIEEVLNDLKTKSVKIAPPPAYPDKSK